ncbi:MAG: SDR family oxidoreductase [Planctomycetes bacterium]|nr:SDR family oxidoreductase [Planctomycetota bacterium]
MKIVITGGAGFIGSHLCEYFLEQGQIVTCLDNLITGREENIKPFLKNKNFKFIRQNVTEFIDIPGKVDAILHFASPASPKDYLEYPIQTLKVGSLGTHKALGLAKAKGARFLLASTSEVYGDPQIHPQPESYWGHVNPVGPRGVYDEAKRFAEAMTMAYHRYHGVDTRIARIFNTYGPQMRVSDGRALPNFFSQAIQGKPVTVFGDGSQTRSFCYIDDMVEGLAKLLDSKESDPVNLGNPEEITVKAIAEEVIELVGSQSELKFLPLPQNDPKVREPDISRAKKLLGWQPKIDRHAGLKKTWAYFKTVVEK